MAENPAGAANESGAGGEQSGGSSGDAVGTSPAGAVDLSKISIDVLPPELHGRSEQEIRSVINSAFTTLAEERATRERLEARLRDLQVSTKKEEPKEPDPTEGMSDEELIQTNVDAALTRWAQKKGLLNQLDSLSQRVGNTEFRTVASRYDDFGEFEDDIRKRMIEAKIPMTERNIEGAYMLALGEKVLQDRKASMRKAESGEPANPPVAPKEEAKPLEATAEVFFKQSGMSREEWDKYSKDDFEIKVKTNG